MSVKDIRTSEHAFYDKTARTTRSIQGYSDEHLQHAAKVSSSKFQVDESFEPQSVEKTHYQHSPGRNTVAQHAAGEIYRLINNTNDISN